MIGINKLHIYIFIKTSDEFEPKWSAHLITENKYFMIGLNKLIIVFLLGFMKEFEHCMQIGKLITNEHEHWWDCLSYVSEYAHFLSSFMFVWSSIEVGQY